MKRFLLVLMSLLMCLSLCACDKKSKKKGNSDDNEILSGPHDSVENVIEAVYTASRNLDADAIFELVAAYNLELVDKYLDGDVAEEFKTRINKQRKNLREEYKEMKAEEEAEGTEWSIEYEIRSITEYEKGTDEFDDIINGCFEFNNTAIADAVTKVAEAEIFVTKGYMKDGEGDTDSHTGGIYCVCIDGDWYYSVDF